MRNHIESLMNSPIRVQYFTSASSTYTVCVKNNLVSFITMLLCDAFRVFMRAMPYLNFSISCFCVKIHKCTCKCHVYLLCHVDVSSSNFTDDVADSVDYSHETNVLTRHRCTGLHHTNRADQSAGAGEPPSPPVPSSCSKLTFQHGHLTNLNRAKG